jgi:hypothetical protein
MRPSAASVRILNVLVHEMYEALSY